ncbi:MAG: SPOR domain-containing protein [Bacteroidaceae bacterium]|nr:SPOR domain-containing protein [Bacteroidaceae bacterium]
MKKFVVLGLGLCLAFGLTSCKSSESAYRKAYEKAKAQETTVTTTEPVEVAPVVTTPVTTAPVSADNVSVRSEKVTLVGSGNLQDYSVVVGSFGVEANARGLQQRLANRGYNSMVVSANTAKGLMYRVIASSFADKGQAAQSRAQLQGEFPDAWLLYRQ